MPKLHFLALVACLMTVPLVGQAQTPVAHPVAKGIWLIPGGVVPNRQPDGNTLIFQAPDGLLVMDTGRHLAQRKAILDFARGRHETIVAIVNSHWHLDHVSGNPDLKRAYPKAKVYASAAIDGALKTFLPKSAADGRAYLAAGDLPRETLEDIAGDIATIEAGQDLRPDVVIDTSGQRKLGGLTLQVNLAHDAATAGDVWLYDPRTHVAAVGDLVTLPAPFLDTGCADGWKVALAAIWATPFKLAIPGHGAPLTRDQFALYRQAFEALVDCADSARTKEDCAAGWTRTVQPLLGDDPTAPKQAQGMTTYYVNDVLRRGTACKAI